jgi:hypothetical protein
MAFEPGSTLSSRLRFEDWAMTREIRSPLTMGVGRKKGISQIAPYRHLGFLFH